MPIEIGGSTYYRNDEVARLIGVSRQSLWRWRQGGRIPKGRHYRGKEVIYTGAELEMVRSYAQRIEPLSQRPRLSRNQVSAERFVRRRA